MPRIEDAKRLLLISNSTLHGSGYLDHAEEEIRDFVAGRTSVIFVPYAVHDRRAYAAKAQERFREMGLSLTSIHDVSNVPRAVDEADVIFVGGGNTFRLLKGLHDHDLLDPIRGRAAAGGAPNGASAGPLLGRPDLKSTKDMAGRAPPAIQAFGVCPCQIRARSPRTSVSGRWSMFFVHTERAGRSRQQS